MRPAPANALESPVLASTRAARMKPLQAARASAEPTDTRRTPRSPRRATDSPALALDINTFTGRGATAFTICAISEGALTPGAKRQSAPASAYAASRSREVRSGSVSPTSQASQRAVRTTGNARVVDRTAGSTDALHRQGSFVERRLRIPRRVFDRQTGDSGRDANATFVATPAGSSA
jgi:hypothetical protein